MRSPHWCLEPGAAQGALETVQEIWLEIGAKEPGLQLLRSYDQHLDLNWSPGCTRVFALAICRPQPGLNKNSIWLEFFFQFLESIYSSKNLAPTH